MTAYLITHPPARRQFKERGTKPSGVIVVHTAENTPDRLGLDEGAEAVARFIARRSDPGSYHDLVDSDSIINLVPYSMQAYHDGTGSNPHSYGVSAATTAASWPSAPDDWRVDTVRNMAVAAARYARWVKGAHGVDVPPRRVTKAESDRRVPGFIAHGTRDPGRRSDPGAAFPWELFLRLYRQELIGAPSSPRWDAIALNARAIVRRPGTNPNQRDARKVLEIAREHTTEI
jgi:hypothetical protein